MYYIMKRKFFVTVIVIIISIASLNSLNNRIYDYSINELGGAAIYYGIKNESSVWAQVGGWVAASGGSAIGATAIAGAAKAAGTTGVVVSALSSNPVGWTIAGIGLIL
jgi:hypothetical protein